MKNPLAMWEGLSKGGKVAVAIGAIVIAAYMLHRRNVKAQQAQADTSSTDASNTDTTATQDQAGMGQDPQQPTQGGGLDPYGNGDAYGYGNYGSALPQYIGSYGSDGNPNTSTTTPDTTAPGALNPEENEPITVNLNGVGSSTTGGGAPKQPHPVQAHMPGKAAGGKVHGQPAKGKTHGTKTTVAHNATSHASGTVNTGTNHKQKSKTPPKRVVKK